MRNVLGRSLRSRLTVLYGLLLTLALALYAAGASLYFLHNLRYQLDLSLDRDIETVEGLISLTPDGHLQLSSKEGEANAREPDHGYLLEVWSGTGTILYRSDELDGVVLGQPLYVGGKRLREAPHSTRLPNGKRVRIASRVHGSGRTASHAPSRRQRRAAEA